MKRVLMVAFHFPPLAGSSGIQRTLRFVQHLPRYGWQPLVLSASPCAFERTSDDLVQDIPPETVVRRAFALDTARHLSIGDRYIGAMARPDRWISWRFDGVRQGMRMIREFKPDAIWSTYPIATAHLIGAELQRRSGLPWIADFRDPMAQPGYPSDPLTYRKFTAIESVAVERARSCVFTTPGAARTYRDRYPDAANRIVVVENGYDEESFHSAQSPAGDAGPLRPGTLTLLHSGIVYAQERDPTALFEALRRLRELGMVAPANLRLRFRAAVHDDLLHRLAKAAGVADMIETMPPLPYREALHEMCRADGLLVLQAGDCNDQIPGKLYEYLRAKRPIVCLTDPRGDTAALLRSAGLDAIADIASATSIANCLGNFLAALRVNQAALPDPALVAGASRAERSRALAEVLARACATATAQTR